MSTYETPPAENDAIDPSDLSVLIHGDGQEYIVDTSGYENDLSSSEDKSGTSKHPL